MLKLFRSATLRRLTTLGVCALALAVVPETPLAATRGAKACDAAPVVTSTDDDGPGTLREAIGGVCDGGSITFSLGTGPHTILLDSTLDLVPGVGPGPDFDVIPRTISITGPSDGGVTLDGGGLTQIMTVEDGVTAILSRLTFANGYSGGEGGGLWNFGNLTVLESTFSGNVADGDGGGLSNEGTAVIKNSTFSGNTSNFGGGGGLFNCDNGGIANMTLVNVTSTNNAAGYAGGGLYNLTTVSVKNSIIAGNTSGDDSQVFDEPTDAVTTDLGNNILSGDPKLGPLQDNGGPTFTHMPSTGSPAIDAGDNAAALTAGLTTDQRGLARALDGPDADTTQTVDIGAAEADPTIEDITDKATITNTPLAFAFNVGDGATPFCSIVATSNNQALIPDANLVITGSDSSRTLTMTPATDATGSAIITVTISRTIGATTVTATDTFVLEVGTAPPAITNATTLAEVQTTSGLVVTLDPGDLAAFIQVSNIQHGALFKNDGVTPIANDDVITVAEGAAGLRFTPDPGSVATGRFQVRSSTDAIGSTLSLPATATITVNKHTATVTIDSHDPNPSDRGQTVGLYTTVSSADGGPAPTGTVTVTLSGGSETCTGPVGVNGGCDIVLTTVGVDRVLTVTYNGDDITSTAFNTVLHTVNDCTTDPVVTTNGDSGEGSLRQAIHDACAGSQITFDMSSVESPIVLTSGELAVTKEVTILGPGPDQLTITATGSRIFNVHTAGDAVIIGDLTLANGDATGAAVPGGGAIYNRNSFALLGDIDFVGNKAQQGGAIFNDASVDPSVMLLTVSALRQNSATDAGGAIFNLGGNSSLTPSGMGIDTVTISGNTAAGDGGGLYAGPGVVTAIYDSTITNNRADSDTSSTGTGGGVAVDPAGLVPVFNTIVAGNFAGAGPGATRDDFSGTLDNSGPGPVASFDLIGVDTNLTLIADDGTNIVGTAASPVDPRLGPLADNGGVTLTHMLLAGSPALDAGDNLTAQATLSCGCVDQRGPGFLRLRAAAGGDPLNPLVDIGAVEADPTVEAISAKQTNQDTPLSFDFAVGDAGTAFDGIVATSSNQALVPNASINVSGSGGTQTLAITPAAGQSGTVTITITATRTITGTLTGDFEATGTDAFALTVNDLADTPSITNTTTPLNTQTTSGLVVTRNPADGAGVAYLQVSGISGGTLFQHNGTTPIGEGAFITMAEGAAGLRFTPAVNSTATGHLSVQASTTNDVSGLGGSLATASIVVTPLASTTVVTTSGSPSSPGSLVTFTATVTPVVPGAGGTVQFKDGVTPLGSPVALSAGGTATFSTAALPLGVHLISAVYSGGAALGGSTGILAGGQIVRNAATVLTGADAGGGPHVRRFTALGGATPSVGPLNSFYAFDPSFLGGVRVAEGDVNGDGIPDYIVGAGTGAAPQVRIVDGATGTLQADFLAFEADFTGGVFVAAGDVNGDGYVDVIVGSGEGRPGEVKVYSGRDLSLLNATAVFPGFTGGVHVAAGDVTGDGLADVVIGTGPGAALVSVLSGSDLSVVRTLTAYPGFTGGVWVAAGDVTGDGYADIVTGAGPGGAPHVRVFDGRTGIEALGFFAYEAAFGGGVRVAVGDVNFDGRADIVTGPGPGRLPEVRVFDGTSGAQVGAVQAYVSSFTGGVFVATAVPVDRMVIETPADGTSFFGGFTITGWALEEGTGDAGISGINVSAIPVGGGAAIALGSAVLGDSRPDVAVIYGPIYTAAGFHLNVTGLAPGVYDLRLTARSTVSGAANLIRTVRVTIGTTPVPLLAIDIPAPGRTANGTFGVAGWALTPQTLPAPGVDAVHVWAAPLDGGPWVFVGAAILGVPRPDVALAFGPQYATAGYYLTVTNLAPGTWDLYVFPRRTGNAAFSLPRAVRVTVPSVSTRSITTGLDAGGTPHVRRFGAVDGGPPQVGALDSFFGLDPSFAGGVRVAEGDLNGDGVPDYIMGAGAGGAPQVRVIDGALGTVMTSFLAFEPTFTGGVFVAAGDVNGDGYIDVIAASGEGRRGEVKVFSGRDFSLLEDVFVFDAAFRGGVHVAAGDVNGDGYADLIVGQGEGGSDVQVLNAFDGSILRTLSPYPAFTGGVWVASGDVTGDGLADVITGAGPGGGPHVRVFDGRTGAATLSFYAYDSGFSQGVRVAAGDVNGDGRADVITAPGPSTTLEVRVFDAVTATLIGHVVPYSPSVMYGGFVATAVPDNRMVIDAPPSGASAHGGFYLAGWAFEENAVDPGIDAIHVWAYPVAGGAPIFGGAATLGETRADVAAIYGAQYKTSGFDVTVTGLPPGTYDLLVVARSARSATFNLQRVVRVVVTP